MFCTALCSWPRFGLQDPVSLASAFCPCQLPRVEAVLPAFTAHANSWEAQASDYIFVPSHSRSCFPPSKTTAQRRTTALPKAMESLDTRRGVGKEGSFAGVEGAVATRWRRFPCLMPFSAVVCPLNDISCRSSHLIRKKRETLLSSTHIPCQPSCSFFQQVLIVTQSLLILWCFA